METIGNILMTIGMVGIFLGILGVIKGNVRVLKLKGRKTSLKLMGIAFVIMIVGALFMPVEEETAIDNNVSNTTEIDKQEAQDVEEEKIEDKEDESVDAVVVPPTTTTTEEKETTNSVTATTPSTNNTKLTGNLAVHFVDVGQGAAQVIITPNNKVMVVDGGNNSEEDTMVNYLNSLGVKKVDVLIGTHPDADHVGGLDAVVDHFDIGQVIMPKVERDTQTFESLLNSIAAKGLKITTAKAGLAVSLDDQVKIEMISPVVSSHSDANEMSAVIKISYGNHSFLLTGDAGVEMENKWIANGTNLQSTVLLVGHHGSEHSTSEAFIKKVKPTYAVIQVGKNSYGHPTSSVLNRLTNNGVNIYRNDTDGTIIFKTDGSKMTVNKNAWKNPNTAIEDKSPATQAPSSSTTAPVVVPPVTTAPTEQAKGIKATASIDNPTPEQYSTVTVTVKVTDTNNQPVSGAQVDLSLAYKSTDTVYNATTDSSGNATLSFKIGRAAKGFTVNGTITVKENGQTATTTTAFTPQ